MGSGEETMMHVLFVLGHNLSWNVGVVVAVFFDGHVLGAGLKFSVFFGGDQGSAETHDAGVDHVDISLFDALLHVFFRDGRPFLR